MAEKSGVAVVTGGSSGIGEATARRLAHDGYRIAILDLNMAAAEAVAASIGQGARAYTCDVSDAAAVDAAAAAVDKDMGPPAVLVTSAGLIPNSESILDMDMAAHDRMWKVNYNGTLHACPTFARRMIPQKRGAIVTIASVAGKDGPKDLSIYASSKAAVIGFTKSWAKELAPHGIRVNCISPSIIEATGMRGEMPDWFSKDSVSRIPMGRAATAQEVASVIAFLLSDEASFVVGTCYDVSGGRASF